MLFEAFARKSGRLLAFLRPLFYEGPSAQTHHALFTQSKLRLIKDIGKLKRQINSRIHRMQKAKSHLFHIHIGKYPGQQAAHIPLVTPCRRGSHPGDIVDPPNTVLNHHIKRIPVEHGHDLIVLLRHENLVPASLLRIIKIHERLGIFHKDLFPQLPAPAFLFLS